MLLLAVAVAWGSTYWVAKELVSQDTVLAVLAVRMLLTALALGVILVAMRKRLKKTDFDAVLNSLSIFSRSKMVPCLKDWMLAGIRTGLQPWEWATADLETRPDLSQPRGQRVWLHVINAKATQATHRTLEISGFSDATLAAVRQTIARATEWSSAKKFDRRRLQCTQLLDQAFAGLFPRQQQRCSLQSDGGSFGLR